MSECILGIDTSNYKTSAAVLDPEHIICDIRRFLDVKQGEKGLRQSDALFQHIKNLPELFEELRQEYRGDFAAVAVSSKPRPAEGSYMPVFLAGESFARTVGAMLDIPVICFSHQEGHMQAIRSYTEMGFMEEFLACHFSGGTCEILRVKNRPRPQITISPGYSFVNGEGMFYDINIVGGSKDISFGQVLDRAGVAMGFSFPAGEKLDDIAARTKHASNMLTPIRVNDAQVNLSGIDTQIKNKLQNLSLSRSYITSDDQVRNEMIREIFVRISDGIAEMLRQASKKTGLNDIIMSGGVSSSRFIRSYVSDILDDEGIIVYFDDEDLATDNAVGTALLGGKYIWERYR